MAVKHGQKSVSEDEADFSPPTLAISRPWLLQQATTMDV
jgi:hypothetical protein